MDIWELLTGAGLTLTGTVITNNLQNKKQLKVQNESITKYLISSIEQLLEDSKRQVDIFNEMAKSITKDDFKLPDLVQIPANPVFELAQKVTQESYYLAFIKEFKSELKPHRKFYYIKHVVIALSQQIGDTFSRFEEAREKDNERKKEYGEMYYELIRMIENWTLANAGTEPNIFAVIQYTYLKSKSAEGDYQLLELHNKFIQPLNNYFSTHKPSGDLVNIAIFLRDMGSKFVQIGFHNRNIATIIASQHAAITKNLENIQNWKKGLNNFAFYVL